MTDTTRDPIADWNAQFAPAPAAAPEVVTIVEAKRAATVEHFADAHGVFVAPAAVEAEPVEAPAEEPKAKGKKGDAESAA